MTASQIKTQFNNTPTEQLSGFIAMHSSDHRQSVQRLVASATRKLAKHHAMLDHLQRLVAFDNHTTRGVLTIGVDEAGRGPLAGPVVAAACVIDYHDALLGLDDSKKISEQNREHLYQIITQKALAYGIGIVDAQTIDQINILQATKLAMHKALQAADIDYKAVITDYVDLTDLAVKVYPVVKGDQKSLAVAAASILAKVTRDRLMLEYHQQYPQYGFNAHKGYGTAMHYTALRQHGLTPIHRRSFLKDLIGCELASKWLYKRCKHRKTKRFKQLNPS